MANLISRRSTLKQMAGGVALATIGTLLSDRIEAAERVLDEHQLKGRINHSACRWCYSKIPLDDLCIAAKNMGLGAIDLLDPKDWPTVQKHGLTIAMAQGAGMGITKGFNNPQLHDALVKSYEEIIPMVADAGLTQIICFSGNRNGMDDTTGMENAAVGLKRLMPTAEKYKVTMVLELLNSKVNHKDYMCDHTAWGAALIDKVGSDRLKLLYDIYHMQIMEGDVISTIKKYHSYIAHYHTGGVPGRNEIDDTQELNYAAIMRAIADTGFKGFVAQEFVPKNPDVLASLKRCVEICDV